MAAKKSAPRKARQASSAKKSAAKPQAPKAAPSFGKGDDDPWANRNTIQMVTGPANPPAPPSEPAETPQQFGAAPHLSPAAPISQPAGASPRGRQSGARRSGQSAESTVGGPRSTRSTGAGSGSGAVVPAASTHSTTSAASSGAGGASSGDSAA